MYNYAIIFDFLKLVLENVSKVLCSRNDTIIQHTLDWIKLSSLATAGPIQYPVIETNDYFSSIGKFRIGKKRWIRECSSLLHRVITRQKTISKFAAFDSVDL